MLDRYEPAINDYEMLTCFLKMRNWRQEEQLLLEIFISRNECPDISFFFFQQLPLGITRLRLTLSLTSSSVTLTQACPPSLWSSFLLVPGSSIFSSCPSSALCLQADHHELSLWCTLFQSCPSSLVLMKIFSSATSKYPSLLNNKHKLWLTRLLVWATGWRK